MRELKLEEIGHVYGAGSDGPGRSECAPGHNKDSKKSKGSKHSDGSKHSGGSKHSKASNCL